MKILITGGAGFIGSALAKKIVERGDAVIILDNLSPQVHGEGADFSDDLKGICECVPGDIRDENVIRSLVGRVDGVMHMAAETGMGQSMYQAEQYADVNVRATGILLDAIVSLNKGNMEKVFIPSTSRVYGEGHYRCEEHGDFYPQNRLREDLEKEVWGHLCPVCRVSMEPLKNKEDGIINPTSIYGISKLAQERMLLVWSRANTIPAFSLRYQNVYGAGQSLLNPYTGVLSIFAQQILNNTIPEIYEMGNPARDFVCIDDVVDCTLKAFYSDKTGAGETLNLGRGEAEPIYNVAKLMMRQLGIEGDPVFSKKFRIGDVLHGCSDMSLTKKTLDWTSKVNIEEGAKSFVNSLVNGVNIKDYSGIAEKKLIDAGLMGGS